MCFTHFIHHSSIACGWHHDTYVADYAFMAGNTIQLQFNSRDSSLSTILFETLANATNVASLRIVDLGFTLVYGVLPMKQFAIMEDKGVTACSDS